MTLEELQRHIDRMYGAKDRARGSAATFLWFAEEVGELAAALASGDRQAQAAEFADVLAWLVTLANVENVDLTAALDAKYAACPGCGELVCSCRAKD